jgi:hypothetical protein
MNIYFKKEQRTTTSQVKCSTQAKVVYMPLVVKTKTEKSSYDEDGEKVKINFKKFKKIPKLTATTTQSNLNHNHNHNHKKKDKFKRFKEEPFDLNSQFDMFMSSMN